MPPPKRPPEKPKNVFKTLKRIFSYLSDDKLLLVFFFLGIVIIFLLRKVKRSFQRILSQRTTTPSEAV